MARLGGAKCIRTYMSAAPNKPDTGKGQKGRKAALPF